MRPKRGLYSGNEPKLASHEHRGDCLWIRQLSTAMILKLLKRVRQVVSMSVELGEFEASMTARTSGRFSSGRTNVMVSIGLSCGDNWLRSEKKLDFEDIFES